MNTSKMVKFLGGGKWLVVMALAACGGQSADGTALGGAGVPPVGAAGTGGAETGLSQAGAPSVDAAGSAGRGVGEIATGGAAGAETMTAASGKGGAVGIAGASGGGPSQGGQPSAGETGIAGSPASGGEAGSLPQGGAQNGGSGGLSGGAGGSSGEPSAGSGGINSAGTGGAPTVCECSTGQCCDGCHFRMASYFLGQLPQYSSCIGALSSSSAKLDIYNKFCDGVSADGFRWGPHIEDLTYLCSEEFVGGVCVQSQPSDLAACEPPP